MSDSDVPIEKSDSDSSSSAKKEKQEKKTEKSDEEKAKKQTKVVHQDVQFKSDSTSDEQAEPLQRTLSDSDQNEPPPKQETRGTPDMRETKNVSEAIAKFKDQQGNHADNDSSDIEKVYEDTLETPRLTGKENKPLLDQNQQTNQPAQKSSKCCLLL